LVRWRDDTSDAQSLATVPSPNGLIISAPLAGRRGCGAALHATKLRIAIATLACSAALLASLIYAVPRTTGVNSRLQKSGEVNSCLSQGSFKLDLIALRNLPPDRLPLFPGGSANAGKIPTSVELHILAHRFGRHRRVGRILGLGTVAGICLGASVNETSSRTPVHRLPCGRSCQTECIWKERFPRTQTDKCGFRAGADEGWKCDRSSFRRE
jgi:hypothetical protein